MGNLQLWISRLIIPDHCDCAVFHALADPSCSAGLHLTSVVSSNFSATAKTSVLASWLRSEYVFPYLHLDANAWLFDSIGLLERIPADSSSTAWHFWSGEVQGG